MFSFGIGEDTHFEEYMLNSYEKSLVYAFDPTPKSVSFVKPLEKNNRFHFKSVGLSDKNEETIFLMPNNENNVSCSVIDHSGVGNTSIPVKMNTLKTLMDEYDVKHIDILKMDIEGSEFKVMPQIFASGIFPDQICVELHERFFRWKEKRTFRAFFDLMHANNYVLVYASKSKEEFTFVRKDYLEEK